MSEKTPGKTVARARTEEHALPSLIALRDDVDRLSEDFTSEWFFHTL